MKYLSCSYYECQPGDRETFWVVPWQIWDQSNKGPFDTLTPNKRMDLNHHRHRQGQGTTLILSPDTICNDPADRWQKLALALDTWMASLLNSGSRISTSAKIILINSLLWPFLQTGNLSCSVCLLFGMVEMIISLENLRCSFDEKVFLNLNIWLVQLSKQQKDFPKQQKTGRFHWCPKKSV